MKKIKTKFKTFNWEKTLTWFKSKWILILIVLLGFGLRVYGYNWGAPLQLHADEWAITENAYLLNKTNTLEPTFFDRPNHLSIYINAFFYKVASPVFFHGQPITKTFEYKRPFYYGLSRVFMAVVGTLSIIVAYLIGFQFSIIASFIAAIIFAIFPLYVLHSHYVTPDITITFLSLLTILFLIKYLKTKSNKHLIILGIISGLSVAEKYPAIANLLFSGLVILIANYKDIKKFIKNGLLLIVFFFISLFVSTPFLFFKFNKVISSFTSMAASEHLGMQILGFWGNLKYHISDFYLNSGLIISILAILGLILIIKYKKIVYIPLLLGLVYWIGLSKIALHWSRWGLPMYITPLLLSVIAIDFIFIRLRNNKLKYLFIIFLLISFSAQLMLNKFNLIKLTAKDTRVLALEYLKDNEINRNNSIYEGYTPLSVGMETNTKYDLSELKNKNIKYVIFSSSMYGRYIKEDKNGKYKKNIDFYNEVIKKNLLIKFQSKCQTKIYKSKISEISSIFSKINSDCVVGPELKIYKL